MDGQPTPSVNTAVTDPVCGMHVDPRTSQHHTTQNGETRHFCSAGCLAKFQANPAKYLTPTPPRAALPGEIFTCPMHPQIHQAGPGACPICGMALDPLVVTAQAAPNAELTDMSHRFWIGAVLALPVLLLDMGGEVPALHLDGFLSLRVSVWVQFALATPVVLWAGWPFFQRGWASLVSRRLNMFTLIALGTGTAYIDSVVAMLAPGLFPAAARNATGTVPVYFEAAAMITILVLLGQVLELRARARTGDALRTLLNLAPKVARRLRPGQGDDEIPLADVGLGDRLRVRPGDSVPVDGVVLDGHSAVNEAMVTGEAMPVEKTLGSGLIGGTVNGAGSLVMRADKIGADTMLARIVAMVAEAQRSRAPIQRLADSVAAWFVPAVLLAALLAFVAWSAWGPSPRLAFALMAAVSVVIVACPCALGLATPMSIGVGIGKGAGAGVLIKSAEALERMERVDTLVVDKTGTLTEGKPRVTAIRAAPGFTEADVLGLAAALERASEHPLAAAIMAEARLRNVTVQDAAGFEAMTGKGVTGRVGGRTAALGNAALMAGLGIDVTALERDADDLRQSGAIAVFLAADGKPGGVIAIADPVKATARAAIDALKAAGIHVVMLTGDNRITAGNVARQLGLDDVRAEILPQDKYRIVRELKASGKIVAMAGDGVNDAPALAEADIGIAMGTGTEAAIQSAGITLVKGDLTGIVRARTLSQATMRNIRQNLVFAFAYNIIGIPVAAGVLYPAFGILLSPAVAALAMSLSSVSVIGNALRLRRLRL
jgi:Cu+-exporting ATPase